MPRESKVPNMRPRTPRVIVHPIYQALITKPQSNGTPTPVVSTVCNSVGMWQQLSPFILGPCEMYQGIISRNMENAWQFSKVYKEHLIKGSKISLRYWKWAQQGWNDEKGHRYPMGKGAVPEFSLWGDRRLGYIEARKVIYGPLYYRAVKKTEAWKRLKKLYKESEQIVLLDYDAYHHHELGMSLTDVLNNPKKKMGHAFVLAMMLQKDPALEQMEL